MTHGSLFSGIGGFDLAAEWMGWENKFHCEWNEFGQKVLKYYWPNAELFTDITKSDFTKYANQIDILTGGFPCQPYSMAGKRLGKEDDRHLWPEMLRVIREVKPSWVVGENVLGLVNWNEGLVFHEVQTDLEAEGYEVWPYVLPAVSVNAPHRRDRVWFVAYAKNNGWYGRKCKFRQGIENNKWEFCEHQTERWNEIRTKSERYSKSQSFTNTNSDGFNKCDSDNEVNTSQGGFDAFNDISKICDWKRFPTVSPVCNGDDGISNRLDSITFSKWRKESIKAGGNAIVPQVVYQIFKAIEQYEYNRFS
jgi:DNA (cytosine-5)-methyltransferase 1